MAIAQPSAVEQLNSPDHAQLHKIYGVDTGATNKTFVVDASGRFQNTFWVVPDSAFTTISAAMSAASAGDTILVSPGTYTETVTFSQDNISLKAIGSKENTTITQAADDVIAFGTKEGCLLEGFTISVTAADGATDYCISGANDTSANVANIIRNCDITWAASGLINAHKAVSITDGDWEFINTNITVTSTYASTSDNTGYCVYTAGAVTNIDFVHCKITNTNSATDNTYVWGVAKWTSDTGTWNIWDCEFDIDSDSAQAGLDSLSICISQGAAGIINVYNSKLVVDCSDGSGVVFGIWCDAGVVNTYNCIHDATCAGTNNALIAYGAGDIINSYGDIIIDGAIAGSGTVNLYGTALAGDLGYGAVSPGTTGGSGTAGDGNQYVELEVNGVIYQILHDGEA